MEKKLTQERLKEFLKYDPNTGLFTNKFTRRLAKVSEVAGSKDVAGYLRIRIDTKLYLSHRLAWLYVHGYMPENQIDHINRIRDDNRIENLREVSRQCNLRNCKVNTRNKTGVTGVSFEKVLSKWRAQITANNKAIFLGVFKKIDDAVKARWEAEKKYNFPNCNTTSSAYEYLKKHNLLNNSRGQI